MPKCLYCSIKEGIYKLAEWDKPEIINYYCEDHIIVAKSFMNKQQDDFYKYYLNSESRSKLSEKLLNVWFSIHKEKTKQRKV